MANLGNLIVRGVTRILGDAYANKFIGNLQGNADTATSAIKASTADSATNASSANKASIATAVQDYGTSDYREIKIGYQGSGLSSNTITHAVGFTDGGTKIKDISKDEFRNWLATASGTWPITVSNAYNSTNAEYANFLNVNYGNEFRFGNISSDQENLWFNYLNPDNTQNNVSIYNFGDGKGGTNSTINAAQFTGNAASATNADKLDGYHASYANSKPWGTIPVITNGGYMDVGKHFEFHYDNTTGSDYSTVLSCAGNYSNIVNLPSKNGTLALLTDNVASSSKWATPRTITLTGSVTGSVSIDGSQNVSLATTANHTHTFDSLTDKPTFIRLFYDSGNNYVGARSDYGENMTGDKYLEWWNNAGWVHHKAGKYSVPGGTSSQFLKADGSLDSTAYLPLSGGTLTGALTINTDSDNSLILDEPTGEKYHIISFRANGEEYASLCSNYLNSENNLIFNGNIIYHSGNLPAYPTVNNGALNLQASGTTKVTFYANQLDTSNFNIATGSANGTISVAGTDVAVKGLGSNAYNSTVYLPLAGGTMDARAEIGITTKLFIGNSTSPDTCYTKFNCILHGSGDESNPNWVIRDNGYAEFKSSVSANAFYASSDIRLKNILNDINIDFDKLKLIPKKYYTWKGSDILQLGTIAQDIQKIYPEVVSKNENGYLSVDYSKLSIIALAAIDKLNERIKELECQIKL